MTSSKTGRFPRWSAVVGCFCVVLLACERTDPAAKMPPPELFQHWVESFEESSPSRMVYRPVTYSFAPARGREAFEIKENAVFISHPIAPGDGNLTIEEKWALQDGQLIVTGKAHRRRYKLVSVTREKLILERTGN